MMHFVRTLLLGLCVLKAYGLSLSKRFEVKEKLCTSKTFVKMTGRKMHTPHPTPLDPPQAISYKKHQESDIL